MVQSEFTVVIINAEEGMILTQVADVPIKERILATEIALGRYDSAENYKEITESEAEEIRELQEQERERLKKEQISKI